MNSINFNNKSKEKKTIEYPNGHIDDTPNFLILYKGHLKELKNSLYAKLFSYLEYRSKIRGYCLDTNDAIAKAMNCCPKTVHNCLTWLQKEGYIVRNTWRSRHKTRRHIILKEHWGNYQKKWMKRRKIPLDAPIMNILPPSKTIPKISSGNNRKTNEKTQKIKNANTNVNFTDKSSKEDYKVNILALKENTTTKPQSLKEKVVKKAPFSSSTKDPNFKSKLENELIQNFDQEKVKLGMEYASYFPAYLERSKNPIGLIITGLKNGWVRGRVEDYRQYKRASQALVPSFSIPKMQEEIDKRRKIAFAFCQKNPQVGEFKIKYSETGVFISGKQGAMCVEYNQNFDNWLQKMSLRIHHEPS